MTSEERYNEKLRRLLAASRRMSEAERHFDEVMASFSVPELERLVEALKASLERRQNHKPRKARSENGQVSPRSRARVRK